MCMLFFVSYYIKAIALEIIGEIDVEFTALNVFVRETRFFSEWEVSLALRLPSFFTVINS